MNVRRRAWLAAALAGLTGLAALPVAPVAYAQSVTEPPALRVDIGDGRVSNWTLAQLRALPPETARAVTRDGGAFEARGVSVGSLLKLAGLDLNANLGSANVVGRALVARATDGYVAVFGLAEVDPHFGHAPLLVVWVTDDGVPLREGRGPVALVVTGEARPGRWVRQLISLEVRDLR